MNIIITGLDPGPMAHSEVEDAGLRPRVDVELPLHHRLHRLVGQLQLLGLGELELELVGGGLALEGGLAEAHKFKFRSFLRGSLHLQLQFGDRELAFPFLHLRVEARVLHRGLVQQVVVGVPGALLHAQGCNGIPEVELGRIEQLELLYLIVALVLDSRLRELEGVGELLVLIEGGGVLLGAGGADVVVEVDGVLLHEASVAGYLLLDLLVLLTNHRRVPPRVLGVFVLVLDR
mmetsp:Transcript_6695/g.11248  ORF Transcript_6695/g.11248 Transcript_6695/m.11248 type:complete len:233 (-) Transcript_6695:976-1674(-)